MPHDVTEFAFAQGSRVALRCLRRGDTLAPDIASAPRAALPTRHQEQAQRCSAAAKPIAAPPTAAAAAHRGSRLRVISRTDTLHAMQFTEELQLRALSDHGLPRSPAGLGLIRCAPTLCPLAACAGGGGGCSGGGSGLFQPHYRRYNRSRPGGLRPGDPAPASCRLFALDGARALLRPAAGRRLTVLVAGSYT